MYKCIVCDFTTKSKINYEVHIKTKKHLKRMSENISILPESILPESILPESILPETVLPENITLTILEEKEECPMILIMKAYDNLYALKYKHYDIYKYVYNIKKLQRDFKECYKEYDLKRNYWKPIKSQVIVSMISQMREKRELKWFKNNEHISLDFHKTKWLLKMPYIMTDVRDYYGRPLFY